MASGTSLSHAPCLSEHERGQTPARRATPYWQVFWWMGRPTRRSPRPHSPCFPSLASRALCRLETSEHPSGHILRMDHPLPPTRRPFAGAASIAQRPRGGHEPVQQLHRLGQKRSTPRPASMRRKNGTSSCGSCRSRGISAAQHVARPPRLIGSGLPLLPRSKSHCSPALPAAALSNLRFNVTIGRADGPAHILRRDGMDDVHSRRIQHGLQSPQIRGELPSPAPGPRAQLEQPHAAHPGWPASYRSGRCQIVAECWSNTARLAGQPLATV